MVLVESHAAHNQRWAKCFNDPTKSDVVFEAKDGQTFHCIKFVLEVASPYFKKLFATRHCGDSHNYVTARDVEPGALKWILRACYTGDGEVDDDNVVSVMVAAGTYGMGWVEKACMKYLRGNQGEPLAAFEYSKANEKWQEWRVPESGWYHIAALGAKAADEANLGQLVVAKGGEGAMVGGSLELQAGDVVQILTGGMSSIWARTDGHKNHFTGGGGGSFVALKGKTLSLLLAAGGGGGTDINWYGQDGTLNEDGASSSSGYTGGKKGGNGTNSGGWGIGGLGWKAGPAALATHRTHAGVQNGGFGGGGAGLGGGGGYSGGSAGFNNGGGGGGSFIAPQAENVWKKAGNKGHGKVFVWKGKETPSEEKVFLREIGNLGLGNGITESVRSLEIVE